MRWKGTPLQSLRLKKGEWSYSGDFAIMEAANSLQLSRSQFLALDEEDQAWQIAYINSKNRMKAWEMQEQERRMNRLSQKGR